VHDAHVDDAIFDWALTKGFGPKAQISSQPWAKVWRCQNSDGATAILKMRCGPTKTHLGWVPAFSKSVAPLCPMLLHDDAARHFQLFEDVKSVGAKQAEPSRSEILAAYGTIQAQVTKNHELLSEVPAVEAKSTLEQVHTLLSKSATSAANLDAFPGNAFLLFDDQNRSQFAQFFDRNQAFFLNAAKTIDASPKTINHTDLRIPNLMRRDTGELCIFDWDDAAKSAPGWSLHNLFSGCSRILDAFRTDPENRLSKRAQKDRAILDIYCDALVQSNSFGRDDLHKILPLTAVFGILKFVTDMAPYTLPDDDTKIAVRSMVARRFNDLSHAMGTLRGKHLTTEQDPKSTLAPDARNTLQNGGFPAITLKTGDPSAATTLGGRLFHKLGALHIKSCWPASVIHAVTTEFASHSKGLEADITSGRSLKVGDRRYMLSLDISGLLGAPDLLAQPKLLNVLNKILGSDFILGSATAVVSLNGAAAQRWHRDNDLLFPEFATLRTPPFSVAVLVPLVPLTPEIGATQILPGSHLDLSLDESNTEAVYPNAALGDCYLMDSRLLHRGMANLSKTARPVLSLVYQRPWYRDYQNFQHQSALSISPEKLETFDPTHRHLVDWAASE
jgi:hypothetical protein